MYHQLFKIFISQSQFTIFFFRKKIEIRCSLHECIQSSRVEKKIVYKSNYLSKVMRNIGLIPIIFKFSWQKRARWHVAGSKVKSDIDLVSLDDHVLRARRHNRWKSKFTATRNSIANSNSNAFNQ